MQKRELDMELEKFKRARQPQLTFVEHVPVEDFTSVRNSKNVSILNMTVSRMFPSNMNSDRGRDMISTLSTL
jgi:hypothetical protein